MAVFENNPAEWQRLDWQILQNGWTSLYWQRSILDKDLDWFKKEKYNIEKIANVFRNVMFGMALIIILGYLIAKLTENPNIQKIIAEIKVVKWINLKCTINTSDVPDGYKVDIRTKYNDAKTSIVLSKNKTLQGNKVTLMVDDAAEHQAATIVLMDEIERILDKKPTTVGGD